MHSFLVVLIIGMTPLIDHSLLQTIVTFISKKLHNCHTYPMIMLLCLCGFWAHINIVFCNDSEKIFLAFPVNTPSLWDFLSMEKDILLHISRHLSYDMQICLEGAVSELSFLISWSLVLNRNTMAMVSHVF